MSFKMTTIFKDGGYHHTQQQPMEINTPKTSKDQTSGIILRI